MNDNFLISNMERDLHMIIYNRDHLEQYPFCAVSSIEYIKFWLDEYIVDGKWWLEA